ncbi:MAG: cytidylate kinase-like family protein [Lachnospiraceae bacterium]|nr:cytidylate kinase-like family protein [Lachnospiraceae bacterium]
MADKRFVIALTRTCGSGATWIGEKLAEHYGIDLYDKKILSLASLDSGINEALFAKADETMKQSLIYRVTKNIYNGETIPPESPDFTKNDNLFAFQAKVLKELAERESYVCIGRGADYILKDFPNVVSVFVYAPMEKCIQTEMKRLSMDRKTAEKHIEEMDKYRRSYYKYHTGKEWESPYNYDLCINTGEISIEQAAKVIEDYVKMKYGIEAGNE